MAKPTCPKCGSTKFDVLMLVTQRQRYDAESNEWQDYEHVEDTPKSLEAKCAECDTDCTALPAWTDVDTFYDEPDWPTLEKV